MSIKILLADDSITIQKVIGIIFGGDEYALTVVDNGKDALDKAREIVPDVLLIDALMPGMTGYEVCEAVRATPTLAAKPILLLTGSFEPFDENKAKSCGADDLLAKPFESQQIVSKVKALFELGLSRTSAATLTQPIQETPAFQAPPEPPVFPSAAAVAIDSAKPGDIWGAFTPAEAPAATVATATTVFEPAPTTEQGHVFAMVNEEPDFAAIQPATPQTTQETSGSQWIPVEEQTFEFTPEAGGFREPPVSMQQTAFGEISFTETAQQPAPTEMFSSAAPVGEPPFPHPAAVAEASALEAAPQAAVSEEQLRAAIAGASKEVIERIVWEIVPDLAEAMIREAILKIREGR
ncbi:response regulator [Geobacter sp. AOG2]|uniref:response regulator n=1 Tax=Geobacter sp. AOG2 TaxID=1566347 RepID=UPI001CC5D040|nr:response regulator [Geobacter sp. AOG2]GFE61536.1 response regulator [Geobacter sp. AOG2]